MALRRTANDCGIAKELPSSAGYNDHEGGLSWGVKFS